MAKKCLDRDLAPMDLRRDVYDSARVAQLSAACLLLKPLYLLKSKSTTPQMRTLDINGCD